MLNRLFTWLPCMAPLLAQSPSSAPGVAAAETPIIEIPATGQADGAVLDLSSLLEPLLEEHEVPGMGCALIVDGELVGLGAAGLRAAGSPEPVTTADRWHLGSCTKALTATLVARLVEREQLTWETTLAAGFEGLEVHPDLREVTLVQLLDHTAGLMPNPGVGMLWLELRSPKLAGRPGRELVAERVLPLAPELEPGTRMLYSNTGYMVAGALMERATESSWEQLMAEHVFAPLGMRSTGFGPPGTPDAVTEPRGHDARGKPLAPGPAADNPDALGPAGTVHASLEDWARFVQVHLGNGPEGFLEGDSLARLHTPPSSPPHASYALGWDTGERDWAAGPVLSHSGSNTYWYCTAWLVPEEGFALLVTVNRGGQGAARAADAACGLLLKHCGRL